MPTNRTVWVCEQLNDYEPGAVLAVAPDERTAVAWLERTRDAEVRRVNRTARELAEPGEKVERMRRDQATIQPSGTDWSFSISDTTWRVCEFTLLRAAPPKGETDG